MIVCDQCGKSLIDTVDLLLVILVSVNLVFGMIMLLDGTWFGLGSLFLAFLFGAAFMIRHRECRDCLKGKTSSETQK